MPVEIVGVVELAEPLKVPLQVVIGPQMGHKFDEASKKTFMEFLATHAKRGHSAFRGKRKPPRDLGPAAVLVCVSDSGVHKTLHR